jgi:hypothetical protein
VVQLPEHAHQQVLDQLEAGDRSPELVALFGVGEGVLVGAEAAADCHPGDTGPGEFQRLGGVAERGGSLEAVALGNDHAVEGDHPFCTTRRAILS